MNVCTRIIYSWGVFCSQLDNLLQVTSGCLIILSAFCEDCKCLISLTKISGYNIMHTEVASVQGGALFRECADHTHTHTHL